MTERKGNGLQRVRQFRSAQARVDAAFDAEVNDFAAACDVAEKLTRAIASDLDALEAAREAAGPLRQYLVDNHDIDSGRFVNALDHVGALTYGDLRALLSALDGKG